MGEREKAPNRSMRVANWCKAHTIVLNIRLNSTYDKDIIEWLNAMENKSGRIKELIRDDIRENGR